MKRKTTLLKISSVLIASGLTAGASFMASTLHAQNDEKVRLYTAAITARDSGDLQSAKKYLEELLQISPGDKYIEKDLAEVNQQLMNLKPVVVPKASQPSSAIVEATDKGIVVVDPEATKSSKEIKKANEDARKKELGIPTEPVVDQESELLADDKVQNDEEVLNDAKEAIKASRRLRNEGRYDEALVFLNEVRSRLPNNTATRRTHDALLYEIGQVETDRAQLALKNNDPESAKMHIDQYERARSEIIDSSKKDNTADYKIERLKGLADDPFRQDIKKISPVYVDQQEEAKELIKKGRAQFLNGDYNGARETFNDVILLDPNNNTAKWFIAHIARKLTTRSAYTNTRSEMLYGVSKSWELPNVYVSNIEVEKIEEENPLQKKIEKIIIPQVNFRGTKLSLVVETLSELSRTSDTEGKGVNIAFVNSTGEDPLVTIQLRDLSLDRMLANITRTVDYQYDVGSDVVEVRKGTIGNLETKRFEMPAPTLMKIAPAAASSSGSSSSGTSSSPFDPAPVSSGSSGGGDVEGEIRNFFKRAGVDFDNVTGASLAYTGDSILVTQNARNLQRIGNLLSQFSVEQVEIEAKFIDIIDGKLEELGFNWRATKGSKYFGTMGKDGTGSNNRSLYSAFGGAAAGEPGSITRTLSSEDPVTGIVTQTGTEITPIPNSIPEIPNPVNVGAGAVSSAILDFAIGGYDVDVVINALEQSEGTDTLSAPKVTVISGKLAKITVAQEFPYPTSWTEGEVDPGSGGSGSGTSINSTIGINPATPQDFTIRNVGVELEVTPRVDASGGTITLDDLTPSVTEFEGFVEYGGRSVAMNANTVVDVPSGIIYPVFAVRKIQTTVVVSDGATIVLGGLTREQTKTVSDKVPVLGDIPFVGRLFRSKGESSLKRNLLVFVTANQVGPGGAPVKKDSMSNVKPGSNYVNTTVVTPSGVSQRSVKKEQAQK